MVKETNGIFISYRRDDSAGYAGRIADSFVEYFGEDTVFRDLDSIEPGLDFAEAIESALDASGVLIAVIGKNWLTATDAAGQKRLANPNDYVRFEITTALKHNIRVIPLLVQRASIPSAAELPDELAPLTRRNAFELHDSNWREGVQRLITTLDKVLGRRPMETGSARDSTPNRGGPPVRQIKEQPDPETVLQAYLEQLTQLIREGLHDEEPISPVSLLARGQTLHVFSQLDPKRKRGLLQILHEAGLIGKGIPVIGLSDADLTEAYLRELHLNGADLKGADMKGANLERADLTGADLSRANLVGAVLSGAVLREANLSGANLNYADLDGTDLYKADLSEAFLGAVLREANLSGANLNYADLSEADLSGAFLHNTDLSEATLSEANLRNVEYLSEADLSNAVLREADLRDTDLTKADLSGLRASGLSEANLSNAVLREADLREADLTKGDLSNADLREAKLWGANLREAQLSEADLSEANLSKAVLREANLSGANLSVANLRKANLSRADLISANLSRAYVGGADLSNADLREADLSEARGWTMEQLTAVKSLKGATMPDGQKYEEWIKSRIPYGEEEAYGGNPAASPDQVKIMRRNEAFQALEELSEELGEE